MIVVAAAPPFATVQDLGRLGHRDIGVPQSGAADAETASSLNLLLGNPPDSAVIEWALAGGVLRFDVNANAHVAIGGAEVVAELRGKLVAPFTRLELRDGDELHVHRFVRGRFLYVAVRGGIDVPRIMGSRSTLLAAAFGGHEGRRLRTGDVLKIGTAAPSEGDYRAAVPGHRESGPVRIVRGPQAALFDRSAWRQFLDTQFRVSTASDRTGYRLEGPALAHSGVASLPSEPTCIGAIQVPQGGTPIVLMHDGPTVGGYPKIAVIAASSLSRFAQLATGDAVQFALGK